MKIGIITFHWATNYGAVLQAFAMQTVLAQMGHDVEIINYKSKQFDNTLWGFLRYRKFLHIQSYIDNIRKEKDMQSFRAKYLNTTRRYLTQNELKNECNDYEVLISGSDQVLNASFLQYGEDGKSTAYFLDFGGKKTKRVCYAVSFGATEYPKQLSEMVRPIVACMDAISVRETTGRNIFKEMGREETIVVPDPTILLKSEVYLKAFRISENIKRSNTYFVYMLHNKLSKINSKLPQNIRVSKSETIEDWIAMINNSKAIITNSFHGTVFSILSHTPFLVVLPTKKNIGMNDRFFTLLTKLGLEDRIKTEIDFSISQLDNAIDWDLVDSNLDDYRNTGLNFLSEIISK